VSRRAATAAPLARVAHVSGIAGDPVFEGTVDGTGGFASTASSRLYFTVYDVNVKGPGFTGAMSQFQVVANVTAGASKGSVSLKYEGERVSIYNGNVDVVNATFTGSEKGGKLHLTGKVHEYKGVKKTGTFSAKGTVNHAADTFHLTFKYDVK
jgi:hypothetical protein